jgi:signal transduction histidine kinase
MPEENKKIIIVIVAVIMILLFLGILFLIMILLYNNRRKLAQKEKEMMQQQFRTELLQTEFEVQEQTRKNLAADLHDNIGQLLSLTNVTLASINTGDTEKARQKIADTQELVGRSIKELRQLSKIIHGEQLIRQGLEQTIEQEITWVERNGHYTVAFEHSLPRFEVSTNDKDLFIYRLFQESLNNILKHSGANQIRIRLYFTAPNLILSISDNGVGFNVAEKKQQEGGLGLFNMQKRATLLKGSLEVISEPNKGTTLIFSIPYP